MVGAMLRFPLILILGMMTGDPAANPGADGQQTAHIAPALRADGIAPLQYIPVPSTARGTYAAPGHRTKFVAEQDDGLSGRCAAHGTFEAPPLPSSIPPAVPRFSIVLPRCPMRC
jgi:hypothetical protein